MFRKGYFDSTPEETERILSNSYKLLKPWSKKSNLESKIN